MRLPLNVAVILVPGIKSFPLSDTKFHSVPAKGLAKGSLHAENTPIVRYNKMKNLPKFVFIIITLRLSAT